MKPWLKYSIIRIALFAVLLTVFLLIGLEGWIAALLAAVIGLCVSYIFFRPLRDATIEGIVASRAAASAAGSDEQAEDRDAL